MANKEQQAQLVDKTRRIKRGFFGGIQPRFFGGFPGGVIDVEFGYEHVPYGHGYGYGYGPPYVDYEVAYVPVYGDYY